MPGLTIYVMQCFENTYLLNGNARNQTHLSTAHIGLISSVRFWPPIELFHLTFEDTKKVLITANILSEIYSNIIRLEHFNVSCLLSDFPTLLLSISCNLKIN